MRYKFDYKSLSFKKEEKTWWKKIRTILSYFVTAVAFSVVVILIWTMFFESPSEKRMAREMKTYKERIHKMEDQMDLMSEVLESMEDKDDNLYRMILEAEPAQRPPKNLDTREDNQPLHKEFDRVWQKTNLLTKRMQTELISYHQLWELTKDKEQISKAIPAIAPVKNPNVISGFGYRFHPVYKILKMHTGLDFVGKHGELIYATADGVVEELEGGSGYGINVFINHGYGYKTLYGHLSKKIVKAGQKVTRGQLVGYMGSTGLSVGVHLHYEVFKNGQRVNPVHYIFGNITPEEYNVILHKASEVNKSLS